MNIFLHELRAFRKSTIIWTLSLVGVVLLFLSLYPAVAKDAADFKKVLEAYPPALRKAMGISIDNVTSLLGFYALYFSYIVLCGAIQAMNLGTSILSKEVRDKTADFLLTKPVSRVRVITAKLWASFTSLIITNVIYLMAAFLIASAVKTEAFSTKIFFMISATLFFVQLFFMALGVIVSVVVPKIKSVLPISLSTVFGFFIINMLGSVIGDKNVRYITPFKYYDTQYIIKNATYETTFIVIEIAFIIAAIAASYLIYAKKDIHAV